jgi:hypothetical protein
MTIEASSPQTVRQQLVLETMRRLKRPIWLGDLYPRPTERAAFAMAFRKLLDAKMIKRSRSSGRGRTYYELVD